jgi:hypothetical protein
VADAAEPGEGADLFPPRGGDVALAEHLVADLPGGQSGRCESLSARGQPVRREAAATWPTGTGRCEQHQDLPGILGRCLGLARPRSARWAVLLRPTHYIDALRNVALVGVLVVVVPVRFPPYSFCARDIFLADVFWILKQGLDFFLYNDSIFR